jgi:cytidine deaminase
MKKILVAAAIEAQKLAYCPYSNYPVGAAILTAQGEIITGNNVENASYGLCICAERNTVFKAVSEGKKEFTAIAVVTKDGGFSCGACRQVLNEFSPNMLLIVAKDNGEIVAEVVLTELLPYAFGPANMGKEPNKNVDRKTYTI